MYQTQEEFEVAVLACDPPYTDRELASLEVAWGVYQAARNTNLDLLVLGRWVPLSDEQHPGIDDGLKANFYIMDEEIAGGAVMQITGGKWTLLVNDAWLIGGIHAHTQFHLASPRTPDNIYNNIPGHQFQGQLTVTGRELAGLASFGYVIHRGDQNLGEVAVCVDRDLADVASFDAYRQEVVNYTAEAASRVRLFAPEHGGPAAVAVG